MFRIFLHDVVIETVMREAELFHLNQFITFDQIVSQIAIGMQLTQIAIANENLKGNKLDFMSC